MCPAGTFAPNFGSSSLSSCNICTPGYYCPNDGTIVPTVCVNGTFCILGSLRPTPCPPGFYCPAKTGNPISCPQGFYCPGQSEYMYKCPNGTYCPINSAFPISCPGGMFGSGISTNSNQSISCISCGRGQYSILESGPGVCYDCTPGYVCLGNTSSSTPFNAVSDGGYMCNTGNYCPLASYEQVSCPIGTFNNHKGKGQLSDCIQCVEGSYNDQVGQTGCKKCGPSASSSRGADTCTCLGNNRRFIKSIGSCLCENGYKSTDGQVDQDSSANCQSNVNVPCLAG